MTRWYWLRFELGSWQANCYVLGDRESGTAVVFDPGEGGAEVVADALTAHELRAEAILLTHGHLDHLWAAPELAAHLDVPVLLHPDDRWLWDDPAAAFGLPSAMLESQLGLRWVPPTERLSDLRDGMTLQLAGTPMTVRHTPGHTPGSCVFLLDLPAARTAGRAPAAGHELVVAGDLIFAGSVGRTDLPRGSWDAQLQSIARVVLPLADDTEIAPGHGPATTVGKERAGNPFLRDIV